MIECVFEHQNKVLIRPPKVFSYSVPLSLVSPDYQETYTEDPSVKITSLLVGAWKRFRSVEPESIVHSNDISDFDQHVERLRMLMGKKSRTWLIQTVPVQVDKQPVNAYILHKFDLPKELTDDPNRRLHQENLERAALQIPDIDPDLSRFATRCAFYLSYLPEKDLSLKEFTELARELVTKAKFQKNLPRNIRKIISDVPSLINIPADEESESLLTIKDSLSALAILCALEVHADIANPSSPNSAGHGEAEVKMIGTAIDFLGGTDTNLGALLSGKQYREPERSDDLSISELRAVDLRKIFDRLKGNLSSVALTESASARRLAKEPFNLPPQLLGIIEYYFELARIIRRGRARTDDLNFTNQMMLEGLDLIIRNIRDGNLEELMTQQRATHEAKLAASAVARGSIDLAEMKKADKETPDREKSKRSKKA